MTAMRTRCLWPGRRAPPRKSWPRRSPVLQAGVAAAEWQPQHHGHQRPAPDASLAHRSSPTGESAEGGACLTGPSFFPLRERSARGLTVRSSISAARRALQARFGAPAARELEATRSRCRPPQRLPPWRSCAHRRSTRSVSQQAGQCASQGSAQRRRRLARRRCPAVDRRNTTEKYWRSRWWRRAFSSGR